MRGATQMFGMMMTVNAVEHLDRHTEKTGRLPFVDAVLHQPGRRGVAQGMRTDASAHLGQAQRGLERSLHRLYRPPVPFHEILADEAFRDPAAPMGEAAGRQRHRRLALSGRAGATWLLLTQSVTVERPIWVRINVPRSADAPSAAVGLPKASDHFRIVRIRVQDTRLPRKCIHAVDEFRRNSGGVKWQIAFDEPCDKCRLARRENLVADLLGQ